MAVSVGRVHMWWCLMCPNSVAWCAKVVHGGEKGIAAHVMR